MKKYVAILLSTTLLFAFSACGNHTQPPADTTVSQTAANDGTAPAAEAPAAAEPVSIGNTITLPFAELTVDEAAVADDIQITVENDSIIYTSGPDSSADTEFIYIRGTLKNTSKSQISNPQLTGTVTIDGYEYEADRVDIIESDGSSAYELAPLVSYTYTLYTEVPNELAAAFTSCKFNFGFEENFESASISSNKEYIPPYFYAIDITK